MEATTRGVILANSAISAHAQAPGPFVVMVFLIPEGVAAAMSIGAPRARQSALPTRRRNPLPGSLIRRQARRIRRGNRCQCCRGRVGCAGAGVRHRALRFRLRGAQRAGAGSGSRHRDSTSDVDVYEVPDGVGTPYPGVFLRVGKEFKLVEPCRDNWCHLATPGIGDGTSWVYQDGFLDVE